MRSKEVKSNHNISFLSSQPIFKVRKVFSIDTIVNMLSLWSVGYTRPSPGLRNLLSQLDFFLHLTGKLCSYLGRNNAFQRWQILCDRSRLYIAPLLLIGRMYRLKHTIHPATKTIITWLHQPIHLWHVANEYVFTFLFPVTIFFQNCRPTNYFSYFIFGCQLVGAWVTNGENIHWHILEYFSTFQRKEVICYNCPTHVFSWNRLDNELNTWKKA